MEEADRYANHFKIKIPIAEFNDRIKVIGELYGGLIESDATLLRDEYWYYTNVNKVTLENSILVELAD